jgi:Cytidylate kinase-like family
MSVVTIRGQLGSGAPEVGRQVADRLHDDYVDREIIAEVAARLRRREQDVMEKEMPPGSLLGRIAEALGHNYAFGDSITGAYLPTWEIPLGDSRYLEALKSVVTELARSQSIVIRGRGSQFILKDYPGALHVLLVAPLEVRVKRVMQNLKFDQEAAKREIERFDSSRREFIKRYFHAELEDPAYYDLVINTERFSFQATASIVVDALHFKE